MPAFVFAEDRDNCDVNTRPVAFAGPNRSEATGATINFDASNSFDPDGRDLNYFIWYFGDGQVGRGAVVSHTYHQAGTYVVTLTVTDICRTRGSDHAIVTIAGVSTDPIDSCADNTPPTASISGSPSAVLGDAILFNGNSSNDADGRIESFEWDFGDGSTESGSLAGHSFLEPGIYTVSLTVTDDCGDSDRTEMVVTITEPNPCIGNVPPTARVSGSPSAVLGNAILFNGNTSSDADGSIKIFEWDFGDGQTAEGFAAEHEFLEPGTYTVSLTVTDDCGDIDSTEMVVTITAPDPCNGNEPPVADAGADRSVEPGRTIWFSGASSTDSDGFIAAYEWNFGDGTSASGRTVPHVFASAGTFTVALTVFDDCGASASHAVTVSVVVADPCAGNLPPTANAGANRAGNVGDVLTFDAGNSSDDGTIDSFRWNFGDGQSASGRVVNHEFDAAGTFTVTLTVTDDCGVSASNSVVVTVNDPDTGGNDTFTADFAFFPDQPRMQDVVEFSAHGAEAVAGDFYFRWDFGDGSYPGYGGAQASRIFADPGTYTVTLALIDKVTWQIVASQTQTVPVGERLVVTGILTGWLTGNSGIATVGNAVWACGSPGGIVLADASESGSPFVVDKSSMVGTPLDIAANESVVAVAAGYGGVRLYDAHRRDAIVKLAHIDTVADGGFRAAGVAFSNGKLFVTGEWNGLRVYDVSDPRSPTRIASKTVIGFLRRMVILSGRAYILDESIPGLRVFDVSNVSNLVEVGQVVTAASPMRLDVALTSQGILLAVAEGNGGLELFEITDPSAPIALSHILHGRRVGGVKLVGLTAFVGYMSAVLELDLSDPTEPREMAFSPLVLGLNTEDVEVVGTEVFAGFAGGVLAVIEK